MKTPTLFAVDNLRFTESGQVWADFILKGPAYGLRSDKDKETIRLMHQSLFRSLPGESLLLGISAGLSAELIAEQMMNGVDARQCPDWAAECQATIPMLEKLGITQRVYWLSVPLALPNPLQKLLLSFHTPKTQIESALGLPPNPPSQKLITSCKQQAQRVLEGLPATFKPSPVTPAQMVWLHDHMIDRGLYADPPLPPRQHKTTMPMKSRCAFDAPLLDEGGTTDEGLHAAAPLTRKFVKVASTRPGSEGGASYQATLVLSDVPDGEILFPGGELLAHLDSCGLQVDWAMRLTVRSSDEVRRTNQRALVNLNEQYQQREGEISNGLSVLDNAAEALTEYAAVMENNKLEVETQVTLYFTVAGDSAESAQTQAGALSNWFSSIGYKVASPIGLQSDMWWQLHPGVAANALTREYAQITTSAALSTTIACAGDRIGDAKGTLVGVTISNGSFIDATTPCGSVSPVLYSPDGATDSNISGSIAIVGDLGSGKSFALKKFAGSVIDRGGRLFSIDRTEMGEWAQWAQSLTNPHILDVSSPAYSLDPLRLYPGKVGARMAQTFLTALLNVSPTSPQGILLSEVLDTDHLARHKITSLGGVTEYLASSKEDGAGDLHRLMRAFARQDLGRVVFDPEIPPLDLENRVVVFLTHTLKLPETDELQHQHLFAQLGIEKIFGRALFALMTAIAKTCCFEDRDRLGALLADEAHGITCSPEGVKEITEFVRDGRKHRAVVMIGSHDPNSDFPSQTLRGLITYRVVMRQSDPTLAVNALQWIGMTREDGSVDPDLIEMLTKDTSPMVGEHVEPGRRGECFFRDAGGNIARVKVLPPAVTARDQAARTGGAKDLAA